MTSRLRSALLVALLPLVSWWITGLFDLDEGFYGAIAAEMNRRGEWITPYYNGRPWFEKPILIYWLAKPCLWLFGPDIGPRMPSVFATLATLAMVGVFLRDQVSGRAGQLGVLVLAGSLLFVAAGRLMLTDPLLVAALTGAYLALWRSLQGQALKWRALTGLALGLGVLAKGPIAVLLFAPVAALTYWREPALRPRFRGGWAMAVAALGITVAAWYGPAYLANGDQFVDKFLIEQNWRRFLGGDAAHTLESPWALFLYVPVLVVGMLPWIGFLRFRFSTSLERYLATWAGLAFLFFTLSGAKLPHYVLPCVPPLAMLIALRLDAAAHAERYVKFAMAWVVALAIFVPALQVWYYAESRQAEAHRLIRMAKGMTKERIPGDRTVATYQLSRRNREDRGTGRLKIQETSLPSLLLYLDANAPSLESEAEIAAARPGILFTRANRISPAAAARLGYIDVTPPMNQEPAFRVYARRY
jgi:4-amino-4-deoxy-L-arabinose transferase-like glycosyltransferase